MILQDSDDEEENFQDIAVEGEEEDPQESSSDEETNEEELKHEQEVKTVLSDKGHVTTGSSWIHRSNISASEWMVINTNITHSSISEPFVNTC